MSSKAAELPPKEAGSDSLGPHNPTTATTNFPMLSASLGAAKVVQRLNDLTDKMKPSSSSKPIIKISVGDPTFDGNLLPPESLKEELIEVIKSDKYNGYPPVLGYDETRQAVAEYYRRLCTTQQRRDLIDWGNVVMTSGVSHGIELAIAGLCNPGDGVLVSEPYFPHYQTVCERYGVECQCFALDPKKNWQFDLAHAARVVTDRTKLMVVINPSNPTGSNYTRAHLEEIAAFCATHGLGLLSDEIYGEMVFEGPPFTSVADLDTGVPRVVLGGSSKWFMCPGWRLGWAVLVDPIGVAQGWLTGMDRLAQLILGPSSICQIAVGRELLRDSPKRRDEVFKTFRDGIRVYERLLEHDIGISFDRPCATMFIIFGINFDYFKDISSDMEFYEKLLDEENVQVAPGEMFGAPGFIRATITRPTHVLNEAMDRIILFCERHKKH